MKVIPLILSTILLVAPIAVVPMAQAQPAQMVQLFPALAEVKLTDSQRSQLEQLRLQTRSQINEIVSPQQQQSFLGSLQSGKGLKSSIVEANLSESQRTQVGSILRESRQQASQVLTIPQRRQILNNIRSRLLGQL